MLKERASWAAPTQWLKSIPSLFQFVLFTLSLAKSGAPMRSNLDHGFSGDPERIRGSRWVTKAEPYREMPINRRFTSQKVAGLAIATTGDPKTPSIHELPLGWGRIARKRATLPPRTRHALQRRRSSLQMQRIFQPRRRAPRTSPAGPCLAWSTRTRSNGPAPRERRPHSLRSRPRRPGPSFSTTASRRVASPLSRRACR